MADRVRLTLMSGSRSSRSYLLRVWREEHGTPWRAMLREVTTKEEHIFRDMEGLVTFLMTDMGETPYGTAER